MRLPRRENLILQASDGHRRKVGSVFGQGATWWLKFWLNLERHERRDSHALGVNEAILDHLDACGVRQVYLLDTAARRIYGTTTATLRRLGSRHRHTERVRGGAVRDWGFNWNLPLERWERVPWFNLGYVPDGAEFVIEAVPEAKAAQAPATEESPLLSFLGLRDVGRVA